MSIAMTIQSNIDQLVNFIEFSQSYLRKNNPVITLLNNVVAIIKEILTSNKKLKIAKYRVNHLSYRLYQMEKLIHENNPTNYRAGSSIDLMR